VYSVEGYLLLWDIDSREVIRTTHSSLGVLQASGVLDDSRTAWSTAYGGDIEYWDLKWRGTRAWPDLQRYVRVLRRSIARGASPPSENSTVTVEISDLQE
jgi:hypothetical protein